MEGFGFMLMASLIWLVFLIIVLSIIALITVIGFWKCYSYLGYDKPWLAIIPFAQTFGFSQMLADDTGSMYIGNTRLPHWVFGCYPVVCLVCAFIPLIGGLLSLAVGVILGGNMFTKILAAVKGVEESECSLMGHISGVLPVVAACSMIKNCK